MLTDRRTDGQTDRQTDRRTDRRTDQSNSRVGYTQPAQKYEKNKIIFFFLGHVGPLHKIQGYQGHQNVRKRRPHHSGDICTTRGNNLKTIFSFMGQNVK